MLAANAYPALLLNADYQPISTFPISTLTWRDSVSAALEGRVDVLEEYDAVIRSPSTEIRAPSVVALKRYVNLNRPASLTRFNVFLRDNWTCQYTGRKLTKDEATFDHVIPRAQGGITSWDNIVTAHCDINFKKADRTPKQAGLKLIRKPKQPSLIELNSLGVKYPPKYLHETWMDYAYWDTELHG